MRNERKNAIPSPLVTDREITLLQLSAGIAGFIGIAGLVALMAQGAWAADPTPPRPGFQPGARPFTNPFANTNPGAPPAGGAAKGNNFFDEDEGEGDEPEMESPAGAIGGGGGGGLLGPQTRGAGTPRGGISVSGIGATSGPTGGPPNGVISHTDVRALRVDDETGEGSKEVVTDFNYPDADIMDIAKTLGKLTGKNFIIDKEVKGRITIISNSPITVGDAWRAFLTALDINGFALIPSGHYIRIARQRDARDKQLKTYTGDYSPDTDALITRVFPLKYINAEEVARTFRSFMPANSRIIPYEQTNTVIVTDTGSNIAKLSKMLELLDVEGYDAGIEVIPVKYASAADLSKLIDTLIPGTAPAPGGAPGAPRFGGGGKFAARRTKEGGIINTIIADERTNTLIVHANTKGADQVRELVAKLDQKQPAMTGGGRVHVVYLQFAEATEIANTLNNLSQGAAPGGLRPSTPGGGGGTGVNPVAASLFEGNIKIAPDKATNSLVITASPADFVTVQRVINRLDIPRDEVFVEVVIMEVSLNRDFSYSANVALPTSAIASTPTQDLFNFLANPIGQQGALLGFAAGKTSTIQVGTNPPVTVSSVQGLIKAIQTNSKANVLATPQIIALDNTEANFESAEKIPVPTQTAVQGAGVSTSITKESVSLSIKIKPQINKMSNFVKLDVETKLGDISNRVNAQVAGVPVFATLDRTAKTTVVVGDADTVVIGGLVRDKINDTVTKVPLLGDIPLLGWLFKAKNTTTEKTNLLVFLTPHIVRQYEKVRAILDKKLRERDEFIESNAGGDDPLRSSRDDMIRSLPDIKELTSKKVDTAVTIDEDKEPGGAGTNPFSGKQDGAEHPQQGPGAPADALAPGGPVAPQNGAEIAPGAIPVPPPATEPPPAPPAAEVPPPAPPTGGG